MTVPMNIVLASKEFDQFLLDVRDTAMLQTHHQAYHTLRAVLHVFRSHLAVADALRFADILPPVVRAIFVESWDPDQTVLPFPDRDALQFEVTQVRRDHNVAPASAIRDVAHALRRHVDEGDLERVLSELPEGAAEFWSTAERS
jgi:uncharacterized protein (DUF2267 family)